LIRLAVIPLKRGWVRCPRSARAQAEIAIVSRLEAGDIGAAWAAFGPRQIHRCSKSLTTFEDVRPASRDYSVRLEDARNTTLRPFKAVARVQIPLGPPLKRTSSEAMLGFCKQLVNLIWRACGAWGEKQAGAQAGREPRIFGQGAEQSLEHDYSGETGFPNRQGKVADRSCRSKGA
jgi:hypothetical protein